MSLFNQDIYIFLDSHINYSLCGPRPLNGKTMVHFFSFLLTCFNIEMHINIFLSCKNMFNIAVSIYN